MKNNLRMRMFFKYRNFPISSSFLVSVDHAIQYSKYTFMNLVTILIILLFLLNDMQQIAFILYNLMPNVPIITELTNIIHAENHLIAV